MNNLLKCFLLSSLILVSGVCSERAYAQRCGGDIGYIIRNEKGEIIDTEKIELKYIKIFLGAGRIDTHYGFNKFVRDEYSIKVFAFMTGCGLKLVEVALEYEGKTMLLQFHNSPMELNFFVDSVPFHQGTYVIDFKSDMALKSQTLNRRGLMNNEGLYVLRSSARLGHLVSAKSWRRVSAKIRLI